MFEPGALPTSAAETVWTESTTMRSGAISAAAARMRSTSSSAKRKSGPPTTPSRCARRPTWSIDSSADAMSTRRPTAVMAAATWRTSVDFPTPGSPPRSSTAPGTNPPPSTRSTSPIPTGTRVGAPPPASARGIGTGGGPVAAFFGFDRSSTSGSSSRHCGQKPIHLGATYPHPEHAKEVVTVRDAIDGLRHGSPTPAPR